MPIRTRFRFADKRTRHVPGTSLLKAISKNVYFVWGSWAFAVLFFHVPLAVHAGQLGEVPSWITDTTAPGELVLNNDDFSGNFGDNPNKLWVNKEERQSITATERVIGTVASGGVTEFALTLGGNGGEIDFLRTGVGLDNVYQLQLGFGTGDDFLRARDAVPELRFDLPETVSPPIDNYTILDGPIPILGLVDHQSDTLTFQGSSTNGSLTHIEFGRPDMLKLPLDIPDLPSSVREFYSRETLATLAEGEIPFTIRMGVVPEPSPTPLVLLACLLLSPFRRSKRNLESRCSIIPVVEYSSRKASGKPYRAHPDAHASWRTAIRLPSPTVYGLRRVTVFTNCDNWFRSARAFVAQSLSQHLARIGILSLLCTAAHASEFFILNVDNAQSVRRVSADGTTTLLQDRIWTHRTGAVTMLPEEMVAEDISADGSTVVGNINFPETTGAVRWTSDGQLITLGKGDIGAYGISPDGSVISGFYRAPQWRTPDPFRWTETSGLVSIDTTIPSFIYGVGVPAFLSADGSVIAGRGYGDLLWGTYRWTEETGMVDLGQPEGKENTSIGDISADGSAIVGTAQGPLLIASLREAWRWTEETGMVGLGVLLGHEQSFANAVSLDGSIVVGSSWAEPVSPELFAWTASSGMISLTDLLYSEIGIESAGTLGTISDLSADQRTLVGSSVFGDSDIQQAWAIEIDRPLGELIAAFHAGDFDRDGRLDADDIDLLTAEVMSASNALPFDLTDDGLVNRFDQDFWIEELRNMSLGDADLDGEVAFSDFLLLSGSFGQVGGWGQGDFDFDGQVQFADFLILAQNFTDNGTTAATVPEPTSAYGIALGVFGALVFRSRRRWHPLLVNRIMCFGISLFLCSSAGASEIIMLDVGTDVLGGLKQVSGDGSTVLFHLGIWTPRTGEITMLPETMDGQGINADGSMVVGTAWHDGPEAVRWTVGGDFTSIGKFPPDIGAWGVSGDGSVVVGHLDSEWFVWNESSGLVPMETSTPTSFNGSSASLVSGDGSTVVGQVWGVFPEIPSQVFRWKEESGITFLGDLPERPQAGYNDISADGDTIVGTAEALGEATESFPEAYRWTEELGMVGLGFLPGHERSFAHAVSSDGNLVVGSSRAEPEVRELFAWTESTGMVSLTDILTSEVGVDLRGDRAFLRDMSDDLRTLVGFFPGQDGTQYWAIELDQPLGELIAAVHAGDFDRDGRLDADDIDLLTAEVVSASNAVGFDLTDDSLVNRSDQDFWIEDLKNTSFGDADLDGEVAFSDFLLLSRNFGQSGGWSKGDFDFDGHVQFADFLVLAQNFSSDSPVASVSEPASVSLIMLGSVAGLGLRRRRGRSVETISRASPLVRRPDALCEILMVCHCRQRIGWRVRFDITNPERPG